MKQTGMVIMVLVALVFAVSGCAKITTWFGKNEVNLQADVTNVTALAVVASPSSAPRITAIAEKIQAHLASIPTGTNDGRAVMPITAEQMRFYVGALLAQDGLPAADNVLINSLLTKIEARVVKDFADHGITDPAAQVVELQAVCRWVLAVTNPGKV